MKLETERLLIRAVTIDDKHDIFTYRCDKETNQYQGWIPETIDEVVTFIGNIADKIDEPDTWFQFVVIEKESNTIIGDIGLHFLGNENKQVEIGCTLSIKFQRKGYATESVKRVIDFLFNDLKKHRIIASIDPENTNSIKLVERIGFRKEAHFIESLFLNGKYVDDIVYALLEKEWN